MRFWGGGWMDDLMTDFRAAVARHPDRVALIDGRGRRTSFAALLARAEALAGHLAAQGVGRGTRVLVAAPLDAGLYAGLAAIWHLGAVAVFPEPAMGLRGLRHAVQVAQPEVLLTGGIYGLLQTFGGPVFRGTRSLRRAARVTGRGAPVPAARLAADDPALISFTSGSTGAPKGILRSHGFLRAQGAAVESFLGGEAGGDEVGGCDLTTFPVFVLTALAAGRTSVLPDWRVSQPQAATVAGLAAWLETTGATRALLPPAICETLARGGVPAGLHQVFTGGGPVFPDVLAGMLRARPDLAVTVVYGSTEAEPIATLQANEIAPEDWQAMAAGEGLLAGVPVPGIALRIRDDEIEVAGSHVVAGYLDPARDAETKRREGQVVWHRTGDAGRIDAQGRLWLLGRQGGAVLVDGRRVWPFQIETAARGWPGVRRAALVDRAGQAVLVVEGQGGAEDWALRARALGINDLRIVPRIPMDARHGSKVDRAALLRMLG
jgi:acyl-CoA synthetase (AMP-forming)/AMP-acid ligase II